MSEKAIETRPKQKGPYLLTLRDVCKQYGSKLILDKVDLAVSAGELCTVVGPSGCGKSTLLRLILGQERASSGEILLEGRPIGYPDTDRGIVYQKYSLFPNLTVLENVILGPKLTHRFIERRSLIKQFEEEGLELLGRMRLGDHGGKFPHELSGGMRQRVAIAQALILKPKILMMDEPFGALDPGTREEMQLFLLELWDATRMTIFFVTHDLEEAAYLGTRVLVLSQFFADDRGPNAMRGAKIVADYPLPKVAYSTKIKESGDFGRLIGDVRREGFDPAYRQHVREFNLTHADSYGADGPEDGT